MQKCVYPLNSAVPQRSSRIPYNQYTIFSTFIFAVDRRTVCRAVVNVVISLSCACGFNLYFWTHSLVSIVHWKCQWIVNELHFVHVSFFIRYIYRWFFFSFFYRSIEVNCRIEVNIFISVIETEFLAWISKNCQTTIVLKLNSK